jgi:hypothetical protein
MENSPAIQRIQESCDKQIHWLRNNPGATVADYMRQAEASSTDWRLSSMANKYRTAEVLEAVRGFKADIEALQRRMEPYIDEYEEMKSINNAEDERLAKAYGMILSAWWDLIDTTGFLRAADRRLRDGDGIPADIKQES